MDNKEILKNAPEGATHISADGAYILYRGAGIYEYKFDEDDEWQRFNCMLTTRKLSDIKRIVELETTIKSLTDGVQHFNSNRGDMNPLLTAYINVLNTVSPSGGEL